MILGGGEHGAAQAEAHPVDGTVGARPIADGGQVVDPQSGVHGFLGGGALTGPGPVEAHHTPPVSGQRPGRVDHAAGQGHAIASRGPHDDDGPAALGGRGFVHVHRDPPVPGRHPPVAYGVLLANA